MVDPKRSVHDVWYGSSPPTSTHQVGTRDEYEEHSQVLRACPTKDRGQLGRDRKLRCQSLANTRFNLLESHLGSITTTVSPT